ncbi:hypothetical protein L1987_06165 [Smallanthus sonchifolius]|uniref:Uncharacterized protein n=1 Tax=Smallanthus sonchifolius TaxID=185202 RepID=A0ACB9JXI2_9ASTR|nr:hypothetical protein L1987_06165 [Smallanthus sonchifolius]
MSARALRKVLKEQESANNFSADDEPESPSDSPRPFTNPFDLLNEQDDEQEQENDSSDADTSSTVKREDNVNKNIGINSSSSNQKSKKKKKKKSKELSSTTGGVDSLDIMLEDFSFGVDSSGGQHQPSNRKLENVNGAGKRCQTHVLQVDPRFLSADNELRRIFGSKVVGSFERSNQAGSSRQSRSGRRVNHSYRKTIIISPSEHWPRWDGSLSMELLENKNGCNYFRYVPSSTYSLAQRQFEAAKATHDLNGIANILLHHPYHIDSLITLAEYYKFSGDLQMSADSTAKALYALECAWHPLFTPSQVNCQLKYEHETNKQFFTTLFTHMKNMDRRGCHRSALEICKLLLSLDSDDPTGALFCIDYFSLRAEEYKWLERFSEEYTRDNSMWLYPNFSYSLTICRFYLEREEHVKETETKATSSDLMKQALMLYPSVVRKLVVKVPLKERVWSKIVNHSFFGKDETGSASLDHLINIYVEKSYLIWRLPELHNFLKDTALAVIEKMEINQSEARDWACVRKEAFASDKNEYSHLMVSDFSDSTPTIPPENLQDFMVDPRLAEMHNNANQENVGGPGGVARAPPPPREVANRNALAVLFESMLPWVNYGTREENDPPQDNED